MDKTTSTYRKIIARAFLAAAFILLFVIPSDDNPSFLISILWSKTAMIICYLAAAYLLRNLKPEK